MEKLKKRWGAIGLGARAVVCGLALGVGIQPGGTVLAAETSSKAPLRAAATSATMTADLNSIIARARAARLKLERLDWGEQSNPAVVKGVRVETIPILDQMDGIIARLQAETPQHVKHVEFLKAVAGKGKTGSLHEHGMHGVNHLEDGNVAENVRKDVHEDVDALLQGIQAATTAIRDGVDPTGGKPSCSNCYNLYLTCLSQSRPDCLTNPYNGYYWCCANCTTP